MVLCSNRTAEPTPEPPESVLADFDPVAYISHPDWLFSSLGLERIIELMQRLGNPQDNLRFVHVAGTNGKGSTCTFLASILQEAGYNVGVLTSPAILDFSDRITVNGQCISLDDLREVTWQVRAAADDMDDHPTEFELLTAVAFLYFARMNCDICIVEVGMGGRLDSTNIIASPEVCVICPISLDHTDFLGSTIEAIAAEKAGIIKPESPVVVAPQQPQALQVVQDTARGQQAQLVCVDVNCIQGTPADFCYKHWQHAQLGLKGSYQTHNAATALEAIEVLCQVGWDVADDAVYAGLAAARWPGRFEQLSEDPVFVVDGGHNFQGAQVLIDSIEQSFASRPVIFVMGVLADKDVANMVSCVVEYPHTLALYCVTPPNKRALPAEELAGVLRSNLMQAGRNDVNVTAADSIAEGLGQALVQARAWHPDAWAGESNSAADSTSDKYNNRNKCGERGNTASPIVVAFGSLYSVAEITQSFHAWQAKQGAGDPLKSPIYSRLFNRAFDRVVSWEQNPEGDGGILVVPGTLPVVISAPHAVAHMRNGEQRWAEPATGALALVLNEQAGTTAYVKTQNLNDDANNDDQSNYRDQLQSYCTERGIQLLFDLHQMGAHRQVDIEIGTGEGHNILGRDDITKILVEAFEAQDFAVALDRHFKARGYNRVASSVARECNIPSYQIEINTRFLNPAEDTCRAEALIQAIIQVLEVLDLAKK